MKRIVTLFKMLIIVVSSISALPTSAQEFALLNDNKLIVGMTGEQPPFNFVSTNENIIGYDVELAHYLAIAMDRELQIVTMPFAELIPALEQGKIDMVMSGLSMTKERMNRVLFSVPYASARKSILSTKTNLKRIYESTGFNDKSVKLVALKGSTSEVLAEQRLADAQLTTVNHYEDGILAVLAGDADGMVVDLTVAELVVFRDTSKELALLKHPIDTENIAVALPKGNYALQKEVNVLLTTFPEHDIESLYQKWFNGGGWLPLVP